MSIAYSRSGLEGADARWQRFFEILPGLSSWTVLFGMMAVGLLFPQTAAALVIAFNLYWLLRLAHSTIFLVLSYALLRAERRTSWRERLGRLPLLDPAPDEPRPSRWLHRQRTRALHAAGESALDPARVHHVVIIPIARETADVVEPGLRSLAGQDFPTDRMIVLLAVEARASGQVRADADALVMAAAVADFRPKHVAADKMKKRDGIPQIELEAAPDVLKAVAGYVLKAVAGLRSKEKNPRVVVGFAAESRDLLDNASEKLKSKNLDLIVANDISAADAGFGVETNRVTLLFADGRKESMPLMGKNEVAEAILRTVATLLE